MGATSIMARRGRFALALACAAAVAHADMADAAKAKPKPRIAKKLQAPAKSAECRGGPASLDHCHVTQG